MDKYPVKLKQTAMGQGVGAGSTCVDNQASEKHRKTLLLCTERQNTPQKPKPKPTTKRQNQNLTNENKNKRRTNTPPSNNQTHRRVLKLQNLVTKVSATPPLKGRGSVSVQFVNFSVKVKGKFKDSGV